MKHSLTFLLILLGFSLQAISQESQNEYLLDGSSMDYYYQNGSAVHAEFGEGQFKFKWILGPNEGASGTCSYRSRKIGDKKEKSLLPETFLFDEGKNSEAGNRKSTDEERQLKDAEGYLEFGQFFKRE